MVAVVLQRILQSKGTDELDTIALNGGLTFVGIFKARAQVVLKTAYILK